MSKVSLDLHLNRAVPTSPQSAAGSDPAAAVLRGHVNFTGVASQCCPAALWPLLAALQQLLQQQQQQQQLQQQLMQQQQGTSQVLPSFGRSTEDSDEGQLRQRHHTSEEATPDQSAAAAAAADDDALGVISSQSLSNANQQPGTEPVAQQAYSGVAASTAGQEAAAAPVSEAEAALSVQWEVCVQASSETQMGVVADNGVVVLGCGVDMVTLRAASGDGSSMKAQSAADIVAQLSLQVFTCSFVFLVHAKKCSIR